MTLSELLIVRSCLRRVRAYDRDITWEKAIDYVQREVNLKTMDPRKDNLNPLYAADNPVMCVHGHVRKIPGCVSCELLWNAER